MKYNNDNNDYLHDIKLLMSRDASVLQPLLILLIMWLLFYDGKKNDLSLISLDRGENLMIDNLQPLRKWI